MIAERLEARRQKTSTTQDGVEAVAKAPGEPTKTLLGGLVLARGVGESIMIGRAVMVEVVGSKSQTARIRIAAPRSVAVHRREVFDAIRLGGFADDAAAPVAWDRTPAEEVGGLVLSRRVGQSIIIGGEVSIEVVEARAGGVRLRVVAPRSVSVHRREVFDAIEASRISG